MKHLPTTVLLDLAEDYLTISKLNSIPARRDGAKRKLSEIDTELLSRMPEGEFITVYDWVNKDIPVVLTPIGFEPYIGEDNNYSRYLLFEKRVYQAVCTHEWVEGYYGIRCLRCDAFVADGHGPWMPVDEGRL